MFAGEEAQDWDEKVQEAKDAVTFQANAMATAYGKELHVTANDILWGMGQVLPLPLLPLQVLSRGPQPRHNSPLTSRPKQPLDAPGTPVQRVAHTTKVACCL